MLEQNGEGYHDALGNQGKIEGWRGFEALIADGSCCALSYEAPATVVKAPHTCLGRPPDRERLAMRELPSQAMDMSGLRVFKVARFEQSPLGEFVRGSGRVRQRLIALEQGAKARETLTFGWEHCGQCRLSRRACTSLDERMFQ